MSYQQVNMLLESNKYENLSSFLRSRDNREAIASFIIDEWHHSTFFNNFPELVYQEYNLDSIVWDVVKIRHWNQTIGIGVVWSAKQGRQLAGNEAMSRSAYRNIQMTFWVHRYAVALENIVDKKILPEANVKYILGSTTKWWAFQDDLDTFFTLFRDYPYYVSETEGLTATEVNERVLSLFGRWTINDTGAVTDVIFSGNGTKGDIEPGATVTGFRSAAAGDKVGLADGDTLTSTFIDTLSQYIWNQLLMPAIEIKGEKPFYGMIVEERDTNLLFQNSNSTLVQNLKDISGLDKVTSTTVEEHPIFTREIMNLYQIKFMKYWMIDKNVDPIKQAPNQVKDNVNSIYEKLMGKAIKPEAKILAAATTGETVTGLTEYNAGYLASGLVRWVSAVAATYQLFVSSGAKFFPYFDGTAAYGADSLNHIDEGLHGGWAATGHYLWRLQVGQGTTATTRYKVVYKWPIYSGTIQVGTNLGINTFIEDAFKLEIVSLHAWNNTNGEFDSTNLLSGGGAAAAWATFKAFIGIEAATKVINPSLLTRAYERNRRIHMFDTVRTIVFGKQLMYKVNWGWVEFNQETRDYGAFTGSGLNVVQGKKLTQSGHGLINNYAIVAFKRPIPLI